jgi:hypothetical protein
MSAPSPGPSATAVDAIKEKAKLLSIYSMMATTAAGSGHPLRACLPPSWWPEYFFTR